jgi:glycerol-3-phosphate responsive antiterminator
MLNPTDEAILLQRGITANQIEEQLRSFASGFPYLEIRSAAEPQKGIVQFDEKEISAMLGTWETYLQSDATILKFVPASGAASRMFKDLFEFIEKEGNTPENAFEKKFFGDIKKFAFYEELNDVCQKNNGLSIDELMASNQYKPIVENLLLDKGLNYGALPKGLLRFHSYPDGKRTPMQEHLVEGALYAANKSNNVNIHFTVSKEHRSLFEKHFNESIAAFEKSFGVNFQVSFSEQKPSTDTIAADENNAPFRDKGELVFRPGGHGALIANLNDLNGDVIFIKNIDNVVPDSLKDITVTYKKVIAGTLVALQQQSFAYLAELEKGSVSEAKLAEIAQFCEQKLNNQHDGFNSLSAENKKTYLVSKLNRPIRVCGMVKNVGEPGGGPFLTVNSDGTVSPQILESSQIDLKNPADKQKMEQSTHFNPVDLVCGVKNYRGEKFDLLKYVDKNTGFISLKSKNGKELKALELPGLWNGAMSDWNTIFVEVPIETFNPVKTVNDLLRPQHQ